MTKSHRVNNVAQAASLPYRRLRVGIGSILLKGEIPL
jgi:hypothetical protein